MKTVILAGGRGTRLAEESHLRPKPMIEIGNQPIIWHIMKIYSFHGINEFVICLGYKGYLIKEYFYHYFLHSADVTIDMADNRVEYHNHRSEPWRVTLVDTGETTMTGGRLKRVKQYLDPDEPFCMTYGDGLADIDITAEVAFHRRHGLMATMCIVRPPARFGRSVIQGELVTAFEEKPQASSGHINGGFFVLSPEAIEPIAGDETSWEREAIERLVAMQQLAAWKHDGFWQPMDTLREKELLESLWESGNAPWKVWK